LEAELKSTFPDVNTNLISSGGGVFEIMLDGNLIFSKRAKGRFPDDGEVVTLINQAT
jgi:selT/selW/selH-like putative selenoprotein|tara:strand:- start:1578 stop:1748 length:171 start_codon:yes stop_codon:yes gene_type:complete